MALPWAEREVPLAGHQIADHPENSHMWYKGTEGRQLSGKARRNTRLQQSGFRDGPKLCTTFDNLDIGGVQVSVSGAEKGGL